MEAVFENLDRPVESHRNSNMARIEALKTLAKLMLYEVESLEGTGISGNQDLAHGETSFIDKIQLFEVELICRALQTTKGNQRKAAKMLGLKATTLHSKMKRYDIETLIMSGQFCRDYGS